jgi:mono/diheme cytochrome c family protein
MHRHLWGVAGIVLIVGLASGPGAATRQTPPRADDAEVRAVLDQYCVSCHNDRLKVAGLTLSQVDLARIGEHAEVLENVVQKLRTGTMPPAAAPKHPDPATVARALSALEGALDREAMRHPNPGRATLRRVNRTEYGNSIRDLLQLDLDVRSSLPPDDAGYGFDNIAAVLKVSPSLLERYLAVARQVSRTAVGTATALNTATYKVPGDLTQSNHLDGLPFGTRGGIVAHHTFAADGEYTIKVRLGRTIWMTVRGMQERHQLDVLLDGERVKLFELGGIGPYTTQDPKALDLDKDLSIRIPVTAGPHDVTVAFLKEDYSQPDAPADLRRPWIKSYVRYDLTGPLPYVENVQIQGPYNVGGPGDTPSRRQIFVCRPATPADESRCARTIVSNLARRAYRRPVTDADINPLLPFYEQGRVDNGFDGGIEMALRVLLVNPEFLFRIERGAAGSGKDQLARVSDVELASRLSFFLWSSIPDDELLSAAVGGQLKNPTQLERQVRRMLADSRSQSLATNFAAQWLYLRNLQATFPQPQLFPDFDDNLRQAMRRETELFFDSMVREDRSVPDLLTADYTFLNERLARHYGIPNIYGSRFRRVQLPDHTRAGLLGQASILTVTSHPIRTSPVRRGKWILENVLGAPPPPPPPDVPALDEEPTAATLTMRQRMEEHRKNPACASCHNRMDPLGLSLETYDAVGRMRTASAGSERIDVTAVMPDGTRFDGPNGLRDVLAGRSDQFVQTFTEKLLTFALGRGLESYDPPAVRAVLRQASARHYSFSSIILGIVNSTPFQMRWSAALPAAPATTPGR